MIEIVQCMYSTNCSITVFFPLMLLNCLLWWLGRPSFDVLRNTFYLPERISMYTWLSKSHMLNALLQYIEQSVENVTNRGYANELWMCSLLSFHPRWFVEEALHLPAKCCWLTTAGPLNTCLKIYRNYQTVLYNSQ